MAAAQKKSTEYEAVSIRHVDETNAKIMNSFVGLCKVENGDAAGLCNIISKHIKDAGIEELEKNLSA